LAKTLSEILRSQADFDQQHQGNVPFFEPVSASNVGALEHLIVCLVGELGELANDVKKVRRGDVDYMESKASIVEETVDVFIYVLKLANQIGFDLEEQYERKMEINRTRFQRFES
jgi:NTP pyrophosphatase (non-canonical NTP hydrolase)